MTDTPKPSISGHCNCGAVRFAVSGPTSDIYVCHCSICRRWTGMGGIAVVIAAKDLFRWTAGAGMVRTWHKPGHDWVSSFCTLCGSAVPGENDAEQMFIPAGAISEGGKTLKVSDRIFVGSKAPWDIIGDDARQHMGHYEGEG